MDNIKHIFIILIFPTKSVFKLKKKHAVHNIHRLACGPYAYGGPGPQRVHVLRRHWYHYPLFQLFYCFMSHLYFYFADNRI